MKVTRSHGEGEAHLRPVRIEFWWEDEGGGAPVRLVPPRSRPSMVGGRVDPTRTFRLRIVIPLPISLLILSSCLSSQQMEPGGNANCSPLHHRHTLRTPYVHALLAARLLLLKVICPFKMYVILVNLDTEFFCISRYNVLSRCVAKYCLIESPNCMTWKSK